MIVQFRSRLIPTFGLAALVLAISLPGCGEGEQFGQEFEPPPQPATIVEDPPDTGDDLHPRDR